MPATSIPSELYWLRLSDVEVALHGAPAAALAHMCTSEQTHKCAIAITVTRDYSATQ